MSDKQGAYGISIAKHPLMGNDNYTIECNSFNLSNGGIGIASKPWYNLNDTYIKPLGSASKPCGNSWGSTTYSFENNAMYNGAVLPIIYWAEQNEYSLPVMYNYYNTPSLQYIQINQGNIKVCQ